MSSEQATGPMASAELLTPRQLSARWGLAVHTLENWRSNGRGPEHVKLGRSVRYRLPDVEAFEQATPEATRRTDPPTGG